MIDLEVLKKAMVAEDINIDDERIVRAFRVATNPGGCKHCGARTLVGVPTTTKVKGKAVDSLKSACCNKEIM
ncbi:MAG TPA: hypothetical protein VFK47_00865 [Ktedonobacteraceae bacterium]|nr:hypothetical protein [Ktedonobacteraceae bacterium]